ncbi:hypothetical protein CCMA1212_001156 [Trichoderma ghanense]|uniref:Uncharacterized protein n=1 Tax=Trichoderma ghanense TaxID=65468 RepID=A0ABY2HH13_9HYPO
MTTILVPAMDLLKNLDDAPSLSIPRDVKTTLKLLGLPNVTNDSDWEEIFHDACGGALATKQDLRHFIKLYAIGIVTCKGSKRPVIPSRSWTHWHLWKISTGRTGTCILLRWMDSGRSIPGRSNPLLGIMMSQPSHSPLARWEPSSTFSSELEQAYRRIQSVNVPIYSSLKELATATALAGGHYNIVIVRHPSSSSVDSTIEEAHGPNSDRTPNLLGSGSRSGSNPAPDPAAAIRVVRPAAHRVVLASSRSIPALVGPATAAAREARQ